MIKKVKTAYLLLAGRDDTIIATLNTVQTQDGGSDTDCRFNFAI